MVLRISGAQLPVTTDIEANLQALFRAIDYATSENADILLTPEGSLSGYTPHFDQARVREALTEVTHYATERSVGLALGTCFVEEDNLCYNQIRFYTGTGEFLGFHSKTLRCGTMTEPTQGEINDYAVRPLQTYVWQNATLGALICNDLWANPGCTPMPDPHLTHQLATLGAQVVFHAVNGGRSDSPLSKVHWSFHESNLRLRALASRLWIVTVDNCYPVDLPCSAPSGVLNPQGDWVVQAPPQGEQYFTYAIPLEGNLCQNNNL
jgi:predicted amidohydrolase